MSAFTAINEIWTSTFNLKPLSTKGKCSSIKTADKELKFWSFSHSAGVYLCLLSARHCAEPWGFRHKWNMTLILMELEFIGLAKMKGFIMKTLWPNNFNLSSALQDTQNLFIVNRLLTSQTLTPDYLCVNIHLVFGIYQLVTIDEGFSIPVPPFVHP